MNTFLAFLLTLVAMSPLILFLATPGWRNMRGLGFPLAAAVVVLLVAYAAWGVTALIVIAGAFGLTAWVVLAYSTWNQKRRNHIKNGRKL